MVKQIEVDVLFLYHIV